MGDVAFEVEVGVDTNPGNLKFFLFTDFIQQQKNGFP